MVKGGDTPVTYLIVALGVSPITRAASHLLWGILFLFFLIVLIVKDILILIYDVIIIIN